MVLDYRERKPVGKNRPRKQPVKSLVFSFVVIAALAFAGGMTTGWFMFGHRSSVENQQRVVPTTEQQQTSAIGQSATVKATAEEPPFTFYETLPKGGKAVIGSGINHTATDPATVPLKANPAATQQAQAPVVKADRPQLTGQQSSKSDPGQAQVVSRNEAAVAQPVKPQQSQQSQQSQKVATDKGRFTIQVASCQSRKEAEEIKARYATSGVVAYVVESNIPGKGLWYRVRLGKGLDQEKAKNLAVKFGKSAIVIPEHEL